MDKKQRLYDAAHACKIAPNNSDEVFVQAFEALHGPKPDIKVEGVGALNDWWNKREPFNHLLKAGGYTDAAMKLGQGIPWLAPLVDYVNRTVRLVNGLGFTVACDDYQTRAATVPLAIAASWLRAQAKQLDSTEVLSLEVGKLYVTRNGINMRINGVIPEGTSAHEQGFRFVGGKTGQYFSETGKTYPQEEEDSPFDLVKEMQG